MNERMKFYLAEEKRWKTLAEEVEETCIESQEFLTLGRWLVDEFMSLADEGIVITKC